MKARFFTDKTLVYLVYSINTLTPTDLEKLSWLLSAKVLEDSSLPGPFIGPKPEMVSPWSTNATEIASNCGISGILRIECFRKSSAGEEDPMLERRYEVLRSDSLTVTATPQPTFFVEDLRRFNTEAGLALSEEEISFLLQGEKQLKRRFTDSEIFGFAQINSEHCRHKIFNGKFVIDDQEQTHSLFEMIKETSKRSPQNIVSAYRDNVAFLRGPEISQFAPERPTTSSYYSEHSIKSVLSLKAETHNFPTTVEPFNGASTGSGGEIRDRMAGGRGGLALAGTAVYMTSSPRLEQRAATAKRNLPKERPWKYQTPLEILIKASNGASDFGNKFGQPLLVGSLLTFEMETSRAFYGYDRCIMLAGGVGYANELHALKQKISPGDKVVLLGGDNYRIGMAGGSVSSVSGGAYAKALELSAVQRSNPEMQKRVYNVVRALAENVQNPITSIHDHGAGGHINCFSELLEACGGKIFLDKLPLGDATLSVREIISNESQERMGLIVSPQDISLLEEISVRERSPMYVVGEVDHSERIVFESADGSKPVDLPLSLLFGSSPVTILRDERVPMDLSEVTANLRTAKQLEEILFQVFSLESVACKDWLTNKVDRCVSGRVCLQQCAGPLQLPLNNLGVVALDHTGTVGIASSLGHAPIAGLIDESAGSLLSVSEALTNIVWTELSGGLSGVALSANWMWPAKRHGEDARLYRAVETLSRFAMELGIPVPTGKDSLSMTVTYDDGLEVRAPGTVIVSALAPVVNVRNCVTPDLKESQNSVLLYVDLSGLSSNPLGGSAYAQVLGTLGASSPSIKNVTAFREGFSYLQKLVKDKSLLSGHDVSSGGLITTICEMAFGGQCGVELSLENEEDLGGFLFGEKPGVVLQIPTSDLDQISKEFIKRGLTCRTLGKVSSERSVILHAKEFSWKCSLSDLLKQWFRPSYLFDAHQIDPQKAKERFDTLESRSLSFIFPKEFKGTASQFGVDFNRTKKTGLHAAVIREKGTNGERELAFSLHAAGFDVKDVTMTDLISGRESLDAISLIAFPGGFSNSDVMGSSRGWAGAFRYNEQALSVLSRFFQRQDTLSLNICNGCQLVAALDLLAPTPEKKISMLHNESKKFECSFLGVDISEKTNSIFLQYLRGTRLGVWVAHGEGKFQFGGKESDYDIACRYVDSSYPQNPNGSAYNAAAVSSADGRHLMIMPHPERTTFPWNWGYYPEKEHEISPWMLMFVAARDWLKKNQTQG